MNLWKEFAALIGRICLSLVFLSSGIDKITHFSFNLAYMASKGLPYKPLLVLAIFIELGAGLMILLGLKARIGAAIIIFFVLILTPIFHDFWNSHTLLMAADQMHHFLKNIAIIGGMLYILAYGPGSLSFDGLTGRKRARFP